MEHLLSYALVLLVSGVVSGFLAGLFGIGGGAILVPVLYELFGVLGIDTGVRTHMAVATSLAVIVPTGLYSTYGHHKRGSIDWDFVKLIAPFVVVGVCLGTILAVFADGRQLRGVYAIVAIGVACFLLWSLRYPHLRFSWPSNLIVRGYGIVMGALSTLMGIGAGTFTTGFFTLFGRSIHLAVGTAATLGPFIALPATIGFILGGQDVAGLPPYSLGYVSLLGAALILPTSLFFTPIGVKTAHGLPRQKLELIFALFLMSVGLRFLVSVLF